MAAPAPPASVLAPATPVLSVDDVGVRHHGHDGLPVATASPAGTTFEVARGEAVLLLGPSGSGKSTLALATNGLVPHVVPATLDGTVRVGGLDTRAHDVPHLARHVAMVFQDPDAQVVTGSVLDEVCFGPENLGVPVAEVEARAEDALRRVGLWERRADDPGRLSGGGRQRLAVACALAMHAPLLVLDEPTANLDPAGTEELYDVLRDVLAAGDRAVLLVEHDLDAAVELLDRVVVLDAAGRVAFDGPVREVLTQHADALVALGVCLPVALVAALRLRATGTPIDPLPLTPDELGHALRAQADAGVLPPARPEGLSARPEGSQAYPRTDQDAAPASRPDRARDLARDGAPDGAPDRTTVDCITVDRLTLKRGRTTVLHDLSLRVAPGELVAVVGANGAGKSTLLQAVAGVVRPPRGRVRVAGLDPARADARTLSERVGYVFQNPEHQLVTGSVADELAHGLRIRGVDEAEVAARVEDLLVRFDLVRQRDLHPFLLSGGQKRRLSVGTATVCRPGVLVLDEPTFGQDRARADELLGLLTALHAEGTTVVVATHDMQLVSEHATRVVVVAHGRVVADGAPAVVLGDDVLLRSAGLRRPPLARATAHLDDPAWRAVTRLADLPGALVPA
ncbi:energy-coupling factor transport system ATP-binding protein [Sediminihabitans luteus]|uniref:Energy-coupling factor transport system ATP-binding protein n=1 Tax=Sediminihabitans luteus TaxID=1138585 RepID=A0A2M9CPR3_9CELL|nr:ABC transporter ATP-binding protein [Sediminihabitans luteus]PJJ73880.1 energy-coupling factor transport system ATP-binding protein [Sediminihabitans luteus]GII98208.1 heme ABC transporter ATP-binding protein [Sediminihabitans luteus]